MKEKIAINPLEQALSEILNKGVAGIEKGVDFLNAELPDVIEQLLLWKGVYSVIELIVGCLIIFGCWKIPYILYKKHKKTIGELDEIILPLCGTFGVIIILVLVIMGLCLINFKWLQILIAPKIYLIEYAAELIK
jgi:hypothetical protein